MVALNADRMMRGKLEATGLVPFAFMIHMTSAKAFSVSILSLVFSDSLYLILVLIILNSGPATDLNRETVRQDRKSSEKGCDTEKNLDFKPTC